jgi:glucose/arabinose dehydrogenase
MEFAPDGRLFVCQQNGQLRVIKNLTLLAAPFVSLTTDPRGERGLLGIAFDPGFVTNQFLYVYYTATTPNTHNRVSRFTASGDVAVEGSEVPILDLENLGASNHNGGAIHFGVDGKLYVAVGENAVPSNAQTLANRLGKILRLNSDGSIPQDNPFFGLAQGVNRSIWALGLRNPFTFAVQPGTGRLFINDVGQDTWEEINDGVAGANYGWPVCEGECTTSQYRDPIFQYGHGSSSTTGCAITGGAFYNPVAPQYPAAYRGSYFFADPCGNWIRRLVPQDNNTVSPFATNVAVPVDLKVSAEGRLFYLTREPGAVWMIDYTGQPPTLGISREGSTVSILWPASSSDLILQTSSTLLPDRSWREVSSPVLTTNGQNRVQLTTDDGIQFFRLRN